MTEIIETGTERGTVTATSEIEKDCGNGRRETGKDIENDREENCILIPKVLMKNLGLISK